MIALSPYAIASSIRRSFRELFDGRLYGPAVVGAIAKALWANSTARASTTAKDANARVRGVYGYGELISAVSERKAPPERGQGQLMGGKVAVEWLERVAIRRAPRLLR